MCSVRKTYALSVTKTWSNCRRKLDVPVSSNFGSHRNPKIVVEQYPLVIKHSNGTSKNWWLFSCPSMVDVLYDWIPEGKSHEIPIKSLLNLMQSLFFRWCFWTPWTDLSRVAKACNMALILTTFPLSEAERGRCCKKDSALTNKIGRIVKNRIYLHHSSPKCPNISIYAIIGYYWLVASKVSCPKKMGRWWRLTRLLAGWRRRKRPPKESQRQGIGPPRFQPIVIYFRKPNRLYVCGALQEDGTWWNKQNEVLENVIGLKIRSVHYFPTGPLVYLVAMPSTHPNSMLPPDLYLPKAGPCRNPGLRITPLTLMLVR